MKSMKKFCILGWWVVALIVGSQGPTAFATEGLQPLAQSEAYQDFLKKPVNDFSKMVCVLNYFRTAPVMVQYEGIDYPIAIAYPVGLAYLMTHYRNENPEQWVRRNCYRSLSGNSIIYFKLSNGSYVPARDVLIEKFHELEDAEHQRVPKV